MSNKKYIEVEITDAKYPNISLAEHEGRTLEFKGGLIGQKVGVKASKKKDKFIRAKLAEFIEESPLETEEGCPRVDVCGGCRYQRLTYARELDYKLESLRKLYKEIDIDKYQLFINPSPIIEGYRNKMEYTFGDEIIDGPLTLGLHRKNRFYEIVDIYGCNIVNQDFESIRQEVMFFFDNKGMKAYHKTQNTGALKFLILRYSFSTKEIMVNLVTREDESIDKYLLEEFVDTLLALPIDGKITSIYHTISNSSADAVVPEVITNIYGNEYINEEVNGLKFKISPFSFFQPNPTAAEKIYEKALEFAGNINDKVVYDLYSGTGTISQIFAKKAKKVIGVEIVEEAVEKAKESAQINGLTNCEFIANNVLAEIENLTEKPDLVVLDPPREGVHPTALEKILAMEADKIVYISCNPKTQVRDLKVMTSKGYKVEKLEFFDQFPRTAHVEALVLMTREGE